jgi:hypothetical protein
LHTAHMLLSLVLCLALGTRITGVDDHTFSSTGESFSMIVLPNSNSANEKKLQADDVSLAYEFAKKFRQ